jgi:hypothetical protein
MSDSWCATPAQWAFQQRDQLARVWLEQVHSWLWHLCNIKYDIVDDIFWGTERDKFSHEFRDAIQAFILVEITPARAGWRLISYGNFGLNCREFMLKNIAPDFVNESSFTRCLDCGS